jgi:threonine dehydrogenase-like Zn-dependent dehydrogenase
MAKAAMGQSPAGLFGFSHMMGGYAGGQAEYLRVPFADVAPIKIPDGIPAAMNKGITFRMGQTHVPRYTKPLLEKIQSGAIDPSFVITHRVPLDDAPAAYKTFRDKEDGCIKVVLKP